MNPTKIQKQEKNLKEANLITENEKLIDYLQTNRYEKLFLGMGSWKQGFGYFTENKFIFIRLLDQITIPYDKITKIGKCTQMFLPLGIQITYNNNGKEVTEKFSLQKRDKRIEFLTEKSGISCS